MIFLEIFLGTLYFLSTYAMRRTSKFLCIITMIKLYHTFFTFYFLPNIYFQFFLYKYNRFLHFHFIHVALLLMSFFPVQNQLSFFCALLKIHKTSSYNLYFCVPCLFSMLLSDVLQRLKNLMEYVPLPRKHST